MNLTIPADKVRPSSLFEKIEQALVPLLDAAGPGEAGIKVSELEENPQEPEKQDLSILSGETGFDRPTLARFALAHKLDTDTVPSEFWFSLLRVPTYVFD